MKKLKNVVICSYYSPEEITGIGKYNGEMLNWFVENDVEVTLFSNAPFYPFWNIYEGFANRFYSKKNSDYLDIRSYTYVPKNPGALKKIISELSFFFSSFFAFILNLKSFRKGSLIIVINPPFFLGFFPLLISRIFGLRVMFHIQDLQVDAARELKLLPNFLCFFLEKIEARFLKSATYISTISGGMGEKLLRKKIDTEVIIMPNWSDLKKIQPGVISTWLHEYLDLDKSLKLLVYSGNIGEKQGLEILLKAAESLAGNQQLHFVILGAGLYKTKLKEIADSLGLMNLTFGNLVPKENLIDVLRSSYLQFVIQKGVGADSFLPSKLTNILASGTASVITASKGTTLYDSMNPVKAAKLVTPDSSSELCLAILDLLDNPNEYDLIKKNARKWAEANLDINNCLKPVLDLL